MHTFKKFVDHEQHLAWYPSLGIGYLPFTTCGLNIYDEAYYEKYERYDNTELGARLTDARISFVGRHTSGEVVDVGIGAGRFLLERSKRALTFGYDINPHAMQWLEDRDKFCELRAVPDRSQNAITMWDVLEHVEDPEMYLDKVDEYVFLSIPIFRDLEHMLSSVHYRPEEHCWYFTHDGCIKFMSWHGFEFLDESRFETTLGRKDIHSFAFKRKS